MKKRTPTVFDISRYRLTAAEYFRRAAEADSAVAKERLEAVAREFVALADKAERAIALVAATAEGQQEGDGRRNRA
jgi:molecular chaperone GrpE (heat shock protein)